MSEWRSVWRVTIKYADSAHNGGYPSRQVRARTPRELRRIVEWARRNPEVIGFPYRRIRVRVGETPEACRHGHPYDGASAFRARYDWTGCVCGGHIAYVCRWGDCDDIRIDPPAYDDCVVTECAIVARSRGRPRR